MPCSKAPQPPHRATLPGSLLAGVHIVDADTLLAAHVAAPVEDAVAFLLPLLRPCVVAAAAAEQVAAIDAVGGDIASPVPGAEGARLGVGLAKVGGVLVVDQVPLSGRLEERVLGAEGLHPATGLPVLLHHHLRGAVVLVLEEVPDGAEVGLGPPAGLDLAAARQPVALALEVHVVQDGLGRGVAAGPQTDPTWEHDRPSHSAPPTPIAEAFSTPTLGQDEN